ncbi:hypothetical protein [Paenibacillus sp. NPDC055715]
MNKGAVRMKYVNIKCATVFLLSITLLGNISNLAIAATKSQPNSKVSVQSPSKESSLNSSLYQSITKFEKNVSQSQIVWKENNITLTANKIKLKDAATFEQNVINSFVITKGDKKFTVPTDKLDGRLLDITSVAVSPSNTWLAIQAQRSAGYTLLLANLKTGKSIILNNLLMSKGKKNIESINAYNWSPKEDQIAFSYGDTSSSAIAIYNTKKDAFIYLPKETDYISTGLILWHKNGKNLDYISEYPSDQKKLYRYSLDSKKVELVKKISQSEFQKWIKLDKYKTN